MEADLSLLERRLFIRNTTSQHAGSQQLPFPVQLVWTPNSQAIQNNVMNLQGRIHEVLQVQRQHSHSTGVVYRVIGKAPEFPPLPQGAPLASTTTALYTCSHDKLLHAAIQDMIVPILCVNGTAVH